MHHNHIHTHTHTRTHTHAHTQPVWDEIREQTQTRAHTHTCAYTHTHTHKHNTTAQTLAWNLLLPISRWGMHWSTIEMALKDLSVPGFASHIEEVCPTSVFRLGQEGTDRLQLCLKSLHRFSIDDSLWQSVINTNIATDWSLKYLWHSPHCGERGAKHSLLENLDIQETWKLETRKNYEIHVWHYRS